MKTLRRIMAGLGNLPDLGPHPGTPLMVIMTAVAVVCGLPDWRIIAISELAVWLPFGTLFLIGAYDRAVIHEAGQMSRSDGEEEKR